MTKIILNSRKYEVPIGFLKAFVSRLIRPGIKFPLIGEINSNGQLILDKAALDEANTRRFAEIVAELSSQSQFIIITHNRVTMHAADFLYGVVTGSDGVSKLLSIKLEDAPKYEAVAA